MKARTKTPIRHLGAAEIHFWCIWCSDQPNASDNAPIDHANDLSLIAVARMPVGVDVEPPRRRRDRLYSGDRDRD